MLPQTVTSAFGLRCLLEISMAIHSIIPAAALLEDASLVAWR
jgi:hypothetical protein